MILMNILKERWPQIKQEAFPLFYLCLVNTWLSFQCPLFLKSAGGFSSTIASILVSIIGILCSIYIFVFPEKCAPSINFEHLDNFPYGNILKIIQRGIFIAAMVVTMLFAWYTDFYGMSNTHYVLWYGHWVISFVLIIQAMDRYNKQQSYFFDQE